MSLFQALHAFDEFVREIWRRVANARSLEETLELGFGYTMGRFRMQDMALYWWDPEKRSLVMQYLYQGGTLMEGEEEIVVEPGGALWDLMANRKPVVVSPNKPWVAFVPLYDGEKLMGAVRLTRSHPLPRGRVLEALPGVDPGHHQRNPGFGFLEDLGAIFKLKLQFLFREQSHLVKEQYFQAGTEIATAVVEMPRLGEMLESVSQSIVKNLGFDRVRFYLIEPGKFELNGVVGIQIPGRVMDLKKEVYSLRESQNPLVDIIVTGSNQVYLEPDHGRVVYVPLLVGRQVVGLMVVDNLLSQQVIKDEQVSALKTLAGQIGMAIVNARLFEDIEQQAITDGLTKLYVYRYFQQRLKEEIDRADRYSYSVALVMMDVDNFKGFNDTYGHQLGDKVLEFLAQAIRGNIRRIDLAARYGGDEFVLLLPEISEQETWLMGTRLLNALKECSLKTPDGKTVPIGVTMGVALYPGDAQVGRELIECADKALYWAKRHNRGDISFFNHTLTTKKNPARGVEKMA
jgi:diguanylate cyclase (GGDEF)-like protein